jgi:hypothetical protein
VVVSLQRKLNQQRISAKQNQRRSTKLPPNALKYGENFVKKTNFVVGFCMPVFECSEPTLFRRPSRGIDRGKIKMALRNNRGYVPNTLAANMVSGRWPVNGSNWLADNRRGRHQYFIPFEQEGRKIFYDRELFEAYLKMISRIHKGGE